MEPYKGSVKIIENAAEDGGFELMAQAVDFAISCEYSGQTVESSNFSTYAKRLITLLGGVDSDQQYVGHGLAS